MKVGGNLPLAVPADTGRRWYRWAVIGVGLLVLLELMWELWLAPIRPGGSWLALKALPLALLWPSLARGAHRAGQWLALLLPFYATEGIVRAWSEPGRYRVVAATVTVVAILAFVALLASMRQRQRGAQAAFAGPRK